MKRQIISLVAVLAVVGSLFVTTSALAGIKLKEKSMERIVGHLVATPLYFEGAVFQHELSHAVMVWAKGGQVKQFQPISHRENGEFRNGDVHYHFDSAPSLQRAFPSVAIAPYITQLAVFVSADITLSFVSHDSLSASFLLVGGMVWQLTNWAKNFFASDGSDIQMFCAHYGFARGWAIAFGETLAVVGAARVLYRFGQIFFEKTDGTGGSHQRRDPSKISLLPWLADSSVGLAVIGRF